MRAINRKLDGFGAQVRKAVPYILGGSAYTAWAVKSVIQYNYMRDSYLTNAYMDLVQQAQYESAYQFNLNALNALKMGNPIFDNESVINYLYGSGNSTQWDALRENNPQLYEEIHHSNYQGLQEQFAQTRGFDSYSDFIAFMEQKFPNYMNYTENFSTDPMELNEYCYYLLDYQQFMTKETIASHGQELLSQGIDVDALLNTEVQFPSSYEEFVNYGSLSDTYNKLIFEPVKDAAMNHLAPDLNTAEGLERYGVDSNISANDLLDARSDSPLDLSTLQLEDALEVGVAGALVAVGTGYIADKAMKYFGRNGKGGLALHNLSDKFCTKLGNISNYIKQDKSVQQENTYNNDNELKR